MLILALLFAATTISPIQQADFLVGEWDGSGWILGPNGKQTFAQHESIRYGAGGAVVVIDGLGTATSGEMKGKIAHQAFAVISFDDAAKKFAWRSWRAGGAEIATTPEIGDGRLVWGFNDPRAGHIRFTIRVTSSGEWREIGEASRDESSWMQFLEMTLHRH